MKFLLIGEHFSNNLGDQVISECFTKFLNNKNISYHRLDMSGRTASELRSPDNTNKRTHTKIFFQKFKKFALKFKTIQYITYHRYRMRLLKNELNILDNDYDAAIYIGGSIFMGYFADVAYIINKNLSKKGIPIFYYGCGFEKTKHYWEYILLKKSLKCNGIQSIHVRDSEDTIRHLAPNYIKIKKGYDCALLTSDYFPDKRLKRASIGIGFISFDQEFNINYSKLVYKLIINLENSKMSWEIFTNGDPKDYADAVLFYKKLVKKGYSKFGTLRKKPICASELIEDIVGYEKIISCRLHSLIIAYSYMIPAIGVSWSKKIDAFYNDIIHKENVINTFLKPNDIMHKFCTYNNEDQTHLTKMKLQIFNDINTIIDEISSFKVN